ncbi:MAG: ComEC/Rec2 family competence protein [Gemmobacter sp.]
MAGQAANVRASGQGGRIRPWRLATWPLDAALDALLAARGHLFVFVPVFLGLGIAAWFALPADPAPGVLMAAGGAAAAGALAARAGPLRWRPIAVALALVAAGFLAAEWRSARVAAPVLPFRYYGPVEGRIVGIDRNRDDRIRLTLDRVVLDRTGPVPERVRIVLQTDQPHLRPEPGLVVMTTAHLAPPEAAVEPGGFDFPRWAWFRSLGAVGYTRTPVLARAPPAPGEARVNRLRARIAAGLRAAIPGDAGGFAAAIATGDRSGLSAAATQSLRDSNLSHILSISGMHMALLTAFVFGAVRSAIALAPPLALRVPGKKAAAIVALGAATFYLALSGGNVPTVRAWVMVAVMLAAVLFDRRAMTLRSVALAAAAILLLQPEALVDPGFQMSFAATVALIGGFAALRGRLAPGRLPGWAAWGATLVASSVLAGFASAPFAAAHFNRFADYGLLANLLAGPAMGAVVMPGVVVAAVLAPLGLAAPALWVVEAGCRYVLAVSDWVASLDGAVTPVIRPPDAVLPLLTLGGAWLAGWRGPARLAGLAPMAVAGVLWWGAERPALLVSADGALLGLMGPEGRALSAPRGNGFAARSWLEDDGDSADPPAAAARPGFDGPRGDRRFDLGGVAGAHLTGRDAAARLPAACAAAGLVILAAPWDGPPPGPCRLIDLRMLRATGALAATVAADGTLRMRPTLGAARPWSPGGQRTRDRAAGRP